MSVVRFKAYMVCAEIESLYSISVPNGKKYTFTENSNGQKNLF